MPDERDAMAPTRAPASVARTSAMIADGIAGMPKPIVAPVALVLGRRFARATAYAANPASAAWASETMPP